jgi:nucleotide sugar dehydrogenase
MYISKVSDIKVCIIGVGYVGEHLLQTFKKEYDIIGIDVSEKRVNLLKQQYPDVIFHSNFDNISDRNVFLVSVPTLVDNKGKIDLSCLYSVKNTLMPIVQEGSLIVIESSVYVGATREIFGEFRDRGVYVGFSPERVDPGRIEPKMEDIPKVISGIDQESLEKIQTVYSKVIKKIVPVSSTESAEMCKLYENCFRMVNIAYVNEISDMCDSIGIDCKEVISASSTKPFGFMPFHPGIGVGGHCIPVNPYYLFHNGTLPVLKYSTELMKIRPSMKVQQIMKSNPNISNILIVGIGFKKGEKLLTNSPSYDMMKYFIKNNINVDVYDPLVESDYSKNDITFLNSSYFSSNSLNKYNLVIVNHIHKETDRIIIDNSDTKVLYF